jgi:hypothetical protein
MKQIVQGPLVLAVIEANDLRRAWDARRSGIARGWRGSNGVVYDRIGMRWIPDGPGTATDEPDGESKRQSTKASSHAD